MEEQTIEQTADNTIRLTVDLVFDGEAIDVRIKGSGQAPSFVVDYAQAITDAIRSVRIPDTTMELIHSRETREAVV